MELNNLIKKIYEDNVNGKLSDKRFQMMLSDYEKEQDEVDNAILALNEELEKYQTDSMRTENFMELVHKYTDFTELTTPMLNEFIEKVVVHEATGGRTDRKQKIDVYFNFVGQVELPPPDRA